MRQWAEAKAQHPDAILFFRLGDFYEMFHDDALAASELLDLTLTSRDRDKGEDAVPMCGVPHHAARGYIARLLERGRKVALCEQMEDPAKARGIVRRAVTAVITPGVVLDDEHLEARESHHLAAVAEDGVRLGLAFADVSTGEFRVTEPEDLDALAGELTRLSPRELLAADEGVVARLKPRLGACAVTLRPASEFDARRAEANLLAHFGVATLEGFGCRGLGPGLTAAAAVLGYVREARPGAVAHLAHLVPYGARDFVVIDEATTANLELVRTLMGGTRRGSLLGHLDRTLTAMGARRLAQWLAWPLCDVARIRRRQDAVEELREKANIRADLRESLKGVRDLERLTGRAAAGVAHGRDLAALRESIGRLPEIAARLEGAGSEPLARIARELPRLEALHAELQAALVDEPPVTLKEGGLIRPGHDARLDELVEISTRGKDYILGIERRERERTGIGSLKVRYNKVFGYYLEITRANLHAVPPDYIRKQTMANAERYVTPELKDYEEKVLGAEERRVALELDLFCALRERVAAEATALRAAAAELAELDVYAALAEVAADCGYVRPTVDDGDVIDIEDGRHPVVERVVGPGTFVPNDTLLAQGDAQLHVITGPNMAGKSTVIRQVALITLLAQAGSFVPARRARIGLVDRVFTRVGASDNLARGQSTFMVEMVETANILHNATRRSLVVLDEIGRGTATFDGLSIAWAVAEYLHDVVGARTLFATHYHELTDLARTKPRVRNFTIAVREWKEDVVFLRRLVPGAANRSYGIQVARLAGLPGPVLTRAKEVLANLEAGEFDPSGQPALARSARGDGAGAPPQLALFAAATSRPSKAERLLQQVDPDALTPRQAHELVNRLKTLLDER
jgi:DNA mismatch repair protein MutS